MEQLETLLTNWLEGQGLLAEFLYNMKLKSTEAAMEELYRLWLDVDFYAFEAAFDFKDCETRDPEFWEELNYRWTLFSTAEFDDGFHNKG